MAETPAAELRQAANLMRERAEKATPGPWKHMCLGSEGCITIRDSGTIRERGHGRVAMHGWKEWKADHADAEFVASMGPDVAGIVRLILASRRKRRNGGGNVIRLQVTEKEAGNGKAR
jgi:hypothetical protein